MGACGSAPTEPGKGPTEAEYDDTKKSVKEALTGSTTGKDVWKEYEKCLLPGKSKALLGEGMSGKVYSAKRMGSTYAIKEMQKSALNPEQTAELEKEISLLKRLDHPNVIKLYETYDQTYKRFLVMELASGGELYEDLCEGENAGPYNEARAAELFRMMLNAVSYCHSKGVVHCDLKLENFVFESRKAGAQMKLIDFGLSKKYEKAGRPENKVVGTAYYVAPEVLKKQDYRSSCDMWAMGVILYMMLSGSPPFNGGTDAEICRKIKSGKFKFGPMWQPSADGSDPGVSDDGKDLVKKLLTLDVSNRLTAKDALAHPWFKNAPALTGKPLSKNVTDSLSSFSKAKDLKKLAVDMIAFTLTPDQILKMRDDFQTMDADGSGEISKDELASALKNNDKFKSSPDEMKVLFDAMNSDTSTANISYSEFLSAAIAKNHYLAEERLQDAFNKLDQDGNKMITRADLKIALKGLFDDSKLDNMIVEADTTKDGMVDYHEFLALMEQEDKKAMTLMAS